MARLTMMGIALVGLLGLGGCKSAKDQAKTFKRCGQGKKCKSPNVCIRVGRTAGGICVYPCMEDSECPTPFRCTGAFKLSGKSGRFCRRPSVTEGGDCSRIQDGCKQGHRCFKNKCVRECEKNAHCPDTSKRCLQVVDTTRSSTSTKNLYRGCLDATKTHGQPCNPAGPFCAREHLCYRGSCIKTCAKDSGCPKGQICDGAFYKGKDASRKQARGTPPDIRYCRRAGSKNAACNLHKGKTCARGLFCLSNRCRAITRAGLGKKCHERRGIFCAKNARCFAGRCRKLCKVNQDCPKVRRKPGKCQARTVRKKKLGLCF